MFDIIILIAMTKIVVGFTMFERVAVVAVSRLQSVPMNTTLELQG